MLDSTKKPSSDAIPVGVPTVMVDGKRRIDWDNLNPDVQHKGKHITLPWGSGKHADP
jgi:hypothetical protein